MGDDFYGAFLDLSVSCNRMFSLYGKKYANIIQLGLSKDFFLIAINRMIAMS